MKGFIPFLAACFALLLTGCTYASIGVIGGADGPTSIFVSPPLIRWVPILFLLFVLAVIGMILWIKRK